MAIDLLELAKNYLDDGVANQVGKMLGENPQNTQKAFDGALPVVLTGILQKSAEPGGTSAVMDMMGEVTVPNRSADEVLEPTGGYLGQLENSLSSGIQPNSLLKVGSDVIQGLFGKNTGSIAGAVASYSGVKETSATSVVSLAGPILLSIISRKMTEEGTGISGLAGLLSSRRASVQSALPTELSTLLGGVSGLSLLVGSIGNTIVPPVSTPAPPVIIPVAPVVPPSRSPVAPAYTEVDNQPQESGNGWLPWLLLLLGAVGLFLILRSCQSSSSETMKAGDGANVLADSMVRDVTAVADSANSKIGTAVDSAGSTLSEATAKLGAFFKRKLPSGYELNIPEFGIENNLVKFIEDTSKPVDKTTWFNFDRILFDTGKATLHPSSQEQLNNIAYILKEYPTVEIKIGGYTDNTGSAAVNKKLSQDRADTVMNELVKLGVTNSRVAAEGYGPEHPVASNDTAAGRAENRRIAVRVTKK